MVISPWGVGQTCIKLGTKHVTYRALYTPKVSKFSVEEGCLC